MSDILSGQLASLADLADTATLPAFLERREQAQTGDTVDAHVNGLLMEACHSISPSAGFLGEEGKTGLPAREYWCVDPIDHSRNFSRGLPFWATQIAYVSSGVTVASIITAPALGMRWLAATDAHTTARNLVAKTDWRTAFVSLHNARILREWPVDLSRLHRLLDTAGSSLGFGNSIAHALVADGRLQLAISAGGHEWDYRAPAHLVESAGGAYLTLRFGARSGLVTAAAPELLEIVSEPLCGVVAEDLW